VINTRSEKRDIKKKQKNVLRQIVLYAENISRSDIVLEILLLSYNLHSSLPGEHTLRNTTNNKVDFHFYNLHHLLR
jgi:hypothetical protein